MSLNAKGGFEKDNNKLFPSQSLNEVYKVKFGTHSMTVCG